MTNPDVPSVPAPSGGRKTEWKVRVASLAAFLASLVGGALLESDAVSSWVSSLPVWLAPLAGSFVLTAVTWLAGRAAATKPDYLSPSTISAVQAWVRKRSSSL